LSRLPRLKQLDNVAVTIDGSSDECEDEDESDDDVSTAPATTVHRKLSGKKHIECGRSWEQPAKTGAETTIFGNLQSQIYHFHLCNALLERVIAVVESVSAYVSHASIVSKWLHILN